MTRPVVLAPKADEQIESAYQWWAKNRSQEQAARWFNGLCARLETLSDNPEQYSLAEESEAFSFEVRQLLYGLGRHPTHRALFTVRPDMIYVFAIRHVAQEPMDPEDLGPAEQ